jgi:hypothetical protein
MARATPKSLERWNRAGLRQFRYVNGNAATYLEDIRAALASKLEERMGAAAPEPWRGGPTHEGPMARMRRLEASYQAPSQDPLWEVARAFSRSCHVLTEHIQAFTNEGFVETASQWDYLRRLLGLLDHFPAPPSSAVTRIALLAKPQRGVTTVSAGLALRSHGIQPELVFETLTDVVVDPALNELRVADFDRSEQELGTIFTILGRPTGFFPGQPLVVQASGSLTTHVVQSVEAVGKNARVVLDTSSSAVRGKARIWLAPQERSPISGPFLHPSSADVRFPHANHGFAIGQMVSLRLASGGSAFAKVRSVDGQAVRLAPIPPDAVTHVAQTVLLIVGMNLVDGDYSRLAGQQVAVDLGGSIATEQITAARYPSEGTAAPKTTLACQGRNSVPNAIHVHPDGGYQPTERQLGSAQSSLSVASTRAGNGDLVVVGSGPSRKATTVIGVSVAERATLSVEGPLPALFEADAVLFARFSAAELLAEVNTEVIHETIGDRTDDPRVLPLVELPSALQVSAVVIVEERVPSATPLDVVEAKIIAIDTVAKSITLDRSLPSGFTKGNTVVRANTVLVSHGKRQPEQILGSGDATQAHQSFLLPCVGVTFIPDLTQPTGVRADIDVVIQDARWQQRGRLNDSGPTDPDYTVRVTESNELSVTFGDGIHGRRLPTGRNNVRVRFRQGSGLLGNLPAHTLTELVSPHDALTHVRQPIPTTGGSDGESTRSMRESAPSSTLTFGRSVSYVDLSHLASRHSAVQEALARPLPSSSHFDEVELVVVPAGAPPVNSTGLGNLAESVRHFVRKSLPPQVRVRIVEFTRVPIELKLQIEVDVTADDPLAVKVAVTQKLAHALRTSSRRLGQSLSRADVYRLVEDTPGVAHSEITLLRRQGDAGSSQRIVVQPHELGFVDSLFVDPDGAKRR